MFKQDIVTVSAEDPDFPVVIKNWNEMMNTSHIAMAGIVVFQIAGVHSPQHRSDGDIQT